MLSPRLQLLISLSGIILLLTGVSALHFSLSHARHTSLVDYMSERDYNAISARYHDYDAMILGTSMSQCFRCSELDRLFGVKSHKFTTAAAHISEIVYTGRYALKYRPVKLILCDLNYGIFLTEKPKFPFPKKNYQENSFLYEWQNSLSFSSLKNNLEFLKKKKKSSGVTRDSLYSWAHRPCGKIHLAKSVLAQETPDGRAKSVQYDPTFIEPNVKNILSPFLRENPNVRIICFFPPYSDLGYPPWQMSTSCILHIRKVLMDELLQYKNVELYDFQAIPEICGNFDLYLDPWHYHISINSWMLQQIKEGKYRVTAENRKAFEEAFLNHYQSIDRQKLLNGLKQFYEAETAKK